jgi:hypothetical protein
MRPRASLVSCVALLNVFTPLTGASPAASPTQGELIHTLYEACRVRQQQTGSFPKVLEDVVGILGEELRREMPKGVEFDDPESEYSRCCRRSPFGERTPCLRLNVGDDHWLNVSCTGWVFESGMYWQSEFVDLLPLPYAYPARLCRDWRAIPDRAAPRSSSCGPRQIDLVPYCNAIPTKPWFDGPADDGAGNQVPGGEKSDPGFRNWFAAGTCEYKGLLFDVRGGIQLDGRLSPRGSGIRWNRSYPTKVTGIAVGQKGKQLHLLAGTIGQAGQGAIVATLRVHFTSSQFAEFPLRYGQELTAAEDSAAKSERLYPAEPVSVNSPDAREIHYSLHHVRWLNPRPEDAIATVDFISGLETSHPYILAMTLEP